MLIQQQIKIEKLIGLSLDTNQFTSPVIEDKIDAKFWYDKLIKVYGEEMISHMRVATWCEKTFSAYMRVGLTLEEYLKEDIVLY